MKVFTSKIKVSELSNISKKIRYEAKKGDRSYTDLIDVLFENDFSKNDIINFVKKDAPSVIKDYCINYVEDLFEFENEK